MMEQKDQNPEDHVRVLDARIDNIEEELRRRGMTDAEIEQMWERIVANRAAREQKPTS
jgi:hypothetical protein